MWETATGRGSWPQGVRGHRPQHVCAVTLLRGSGEADPGLYFGFPSTKKCWGTRGRSVPTILLSELASVLAVTWAGGMICESKSAGIESIIHFHISSCYLPDNGLSPHHSLKRPKQWVGGAVLSGLLMRLLCCLGQSGCPEQGLPPPASWTCTFPQVGTLAPQPYLGADGTLSFCPLNLTSPRKLPSP